ncbi:MAG TPA: YoaK family protein [Trebonia sp.]|nr:YoaK family protein [Trebonia sp.]
MKRSQVQLIGLLAFASGCVDTVTLMALGSAFTSVITGNVIFVGRAIGTTSLTPALDAVTAIAGYMAGVAAGSRLAHVLGRSRAAAPWPARATMVLAIEWVILLAVNVAWLGYRARPPAGATYVMLAGAALALGMQGAATRTIAGNPSTTYMTGALTALIEGLATGRRQAAELAAAVGLACLVAGAALTAVLVVHARDYALLAPLAAVALVVAVKAAHHRAEERARAAGEREPQPAS